MSKSLTRGDIIQVPFLRGFYVVLADHDAAADSAVSLAPIKPDYEAKFTLPAVQIERIIPGVRLDVRS